jgi:tetratricopeptide (TPR) repeat protein
MAGESSRPPGLADPAGRAQTPRISGKCMANLFLSYARDDSARLRPLAAALESGGHCVWWDQHIPGGDQFAEAIERALDEADAIIVAWSKASVHSAWVRDEAAVGRDKGRLIPVTFDGCAPPIGFRQYQTIDLSKWNGRPRAPALAPLNEAIAARAGGAKVAPGDRRDVTSGIGPGRRRLRVGAFVAAASALVVVAAALLYPRLPLGASAVTPKVAIGDFALVSPETPRQMSSALNSEILAAFGSEHEVSLITAGLGRSQAPFLLDGTIEKSSDTLHFTVNLKNQHTGGLVWSQSYDRALIDSLAPRQVAVAATQVVRCGLWGASGYRKPMSDRALALYLQWCNEYWGGSPDEDRILDSAKRITAAIPDFSFGWSALALAAVPISHRADAAGAVQVGQQGWKAARKATQLDRRNPEGYMAEAGLLAVSRFADRERLLTKAISVRPTECGCERQSYGDFLTSVGRFEEATEEYDRARAMMPLAPMSNVRLAQALYLVGRQREADDVIARMLDLWPDAEIVQLLQVKAALWTHQYERAVPLLQTPELHLPDDERMALAHAFAALQAKQAEKMRAAATELGRLAADPRRNDRLIVAALAALGAGPEALNAADALIRERGPALSDVLFDPNLAAARSSPGYVQLVRRLGLVSYWRGGGSRPDYCRGSARPAVCSA